MRAAARRTAGVLAAHGAQIALAHVERLAAPRSDAFLLEYARFRRAGVLRAEAHRVPQPQFRARRRQRRLLLDRTARENARRARRLLAHKSPQAPPDGRRGTRAHEPDALLR